MQQRLDEGLVLGDRPAVRLAGQREQGIMHAVTSVCIDRRVLSELHELEVLFRAVVEELRARLEKLADLVRDLVEEDEVAEAALRRFEL